MREDSLKRRVVPVLVPVPTGEPYSYAVPEGMTAGPGAIVRVPLGPRQVAGVVWDGECGAVEPNKLRAVEEVFDCPPVNADMRRFIEWIASYTLSAPGMVARMVLRVPAAFDPEPPIEGLRFTGNPPERMTDARRRVLEHAADGLAWTRSGLAHAAGVSSTVIDGLREQGTFEPVLLPPRPIVAAPDPDYAMPELTPAQGEAAACLREKASKGFSVTLLDGVTGS
ncbi:MAG: primosomal protein N', partial [Rhizobiaceae bacterium]